MMVLPEVTNCVCFVCGDFQGKRIPVGTAFFFGITDFSTNPTSYRPFVVTALHVIAGIEMKSDDGRIWLRVNKKDSSVEDVEMSGDMWLRPDQSGTEITDVAVAYWPNGIAEYEYRYPNDQHVATAEDMRREQLGVGSEVFFAGLFVRHSGGGQNEPIVRSGMIAAIPREPVAVAQGLTTAYLIEARSVGGLSGSPVFVSAGPYIRGATGELEMRLDGAAWWLIGVLNAHWDARFEGFDATGLATSELVNMGIAVATPISAAVDLARKIDQAFKEHETELLGQLRFADYRSQSYWQSYARTVVQQLSSPSDT